MPKAIPKPTKPKESPPSNMKMPEVPEGFTIKEVIPEESPKQEETPMESAPKEEIPNGTEQKTELPQQSSEKEKMPSDVIERNCVVVNGEKIEIKPTKLKYFRNKAASGYGIIKVVPIHELLTYDKGVLDPDRDADQLVYDFLVSVFNDSEFVKKNYNEMDSEILHQVCAIFGRINHIDEKEELARKNREAQAQARR